MKSYMEMLKIPLLHFLECKLQGGMPSMHSLHVVQPET